MLRCFYFSFLLLRGFNLLYQRAHLEAQVPWSLTVFPWLTMLTPMTVICTEWRSSFAARVELVLIFLFIFRTLYEKTGHTIIHT